MTQNDQLKLFLMLRAFAMNTALIFMLIKMLHSPLSFMMLDEKTKYSNVDNNRALILLNRSVQIKETRTYARYACCARLASLARCRGGQSDKGVQ